MLLLAVPEAALSHTKTRNKSAVQSIFCVAPPCPSRGSLIPYKSKENQFHPALASLGRGAPMHTPCGWYHKSRYLREATFSLLGAYLGNCPGGPINFEISYYLMNCWVVRHLTKNLEGIFPRSKLQKVPPCMTFYITLSLSVLGQPTSPIKGEPKLGAF